MNVWCEEAYSDHLIARECLLLNISGIPVSISIMEPSLEELGRLYLIQLMKGCNDENCCNLDCGRNNSSFLA